MSDSTIGKAIHETASTIAIVRADTRKRKNWGYILLPVLKEWAETQAWPGNVVPKTDEDLARRFFGVRLDAPVVRGAQPICVKDGEPPQTAELFAVWRKLEDPKPEDPAPNFSEQPDIEVSDTERPEKPAEE